MPVTPPLDPNELDLLSTYLDGALPDSEHAALEARLVAEPALRAALDELRWTVQLVRATPQLAPPHNFTLDPARFRRRVPWWAGRRIGASLQLVGALGTVASILLIAAGVLSMNAGGFAPAQTVPISHTPTQAAPALALLSTKPGTEQRLDEETRQAASADRANAPLTATPTPSAVPRTSAPGVAATAAIMAPLPLSTAVFATTAPLLPVSPAQPPITAGSDLVRATATAVGFGAQEPGQGDLPRTALAGIISAATPEPAAQSKSAVERDSTAIARAAQATSTPFPTTTATLRSFSAALPSATLAASQTAQEALAATPTQVALLQTPRAGPSDVTLAAANATPAAAPGGNTVGERASAPASRVSPLQVVVIVGITFLVVSIMLFGIGWLRARL